MALTDADRAHLARCLELAERGGRTAAPNPVVGAVVVRDGIVIGEGWHERPGGAHAEVVALRAAGDAAGATVYTSLEPCSHHGRTPPCADALIAARVERVVTAMVDPTEKVGGAGIARLREAGVTVDVAGGEEERRARRANAGWLTLALHGRPHVTYKAAVSADGRTAAAGTGPRWISSDESRALVHEMRAASGAVMVGSGTAIIDDPLLTARDCRPPAERQPLRVVLDRRGRLPAGSQLVRTASPDAPVLVVTAPGAGGVSAANVEVLESTGPAEALRELGRRRIAWVLLEGGATVATALVEAGLVDRLAVFEAPVELGPGPGLFTHEVDLPAPVDERRIGADMLRVFELQEP
ncbi:MAG: bifunctional diaminohydroxyphosphoribosylaminopyrimidine deaminase/5-amino-6-(5-phosphoribosylamino)uracil reductase RibD [Gaiellales bacterium]